MLSHVVTAPSRTGSQRGYLLPQNAQLATFIRARMGTPSSWNCWEDVYSHWATHEARTQGCQPRHDAQLQTASQKKQRSMTSPSATAGSGTHLLRHAAGPSALALLAWAGARAARKSWQNRRHLGHVRGPLLAGTPYKPTSHHLTTLPAATLDTSQPGSHTEPPYGHPIEEEPAPGTTDQWTQTATQHAAIAALATQQPLLSPAATSRNKPATSVSLKALSHHQVQQGVPRVNHRSLEMASVHGNSYVPLDQGQAVGAARRKSAGAADVMLPVTRRSTEPVAAPRPPLTPAASRSNTSTYAKHTASSLRHSTESALQQRQSQPQAETSNNASLSRASSRMSSDVGVEVEMAQLKEENLTLSQALFSKEVEVLQLQQRVTTLESHCSMLEKALLQSNLPSNSIPQLPRTPVQQSETPKLLHNPLADVEDAGALLLSSGCKDLASSDFTSLVSTNFTGLVSSDFNGLDPACISHNPLADLQPCRKPHNPESECLHRTSKVCRHSHSLDDGACLLQGIGVGEVTVYGNLTFEDGDWQDESDGSDWPEKSDSSECTDKPVAPLPAALLRSLT